MSGVVDKLLETLERDHKIKTYGQIRQWIDESRKTADTHEYMERLHNEGWVSVETVTALLTQVSRELDEANLLCELQASRISGLETFKKQCKGKVLVDRKQLSDSLDRLAEDCHDKIIDELKFPAHYRHSGWAKVLQPIIWGWFEKLIHDSEKGSLGDKP